jgi:hypothetical protein
MSLPPEFRDIVGISLFAVLLSGVAMTSLARLVYGPTPPARLRREKSFITRLGWTLILLEVVFLVVLFLLLPSGAHGGMGSMGNPIAALALWAYMWTVVPGAVLALLAVVVVCVLRWRRRAA